MLEEGGVAAERIVDDGVVVVAHGEHGGDLHLERWAHLAEAVEEGLVGISASRKRRCSRRVRR